MSEEFYLLFKVETKKKLPKANNGDSSNGIGQKNEEAREMGRHRLTDAETNNETIPGDSNSFSN